MSDTTSIVTRWPAAADDKVRIEEVCLGRKRNAVVVARCILSYIISLLSMILQEIYLPTPISVKIFYLWSEKYLNTPCMKVI